MTVKQQPNGRWKVSVDVGGGRRGDGTRPRIHRTVDTEAEARRLEQTLKHRSPELDGMTVAGLCEHYVLLRSADLAPQTENYYRDLIARYFHPTWIGQVAFDRLLLEQVRRFYAQLRDGSYLDDNPAAKRLRKRPVKPLGDVTVRGIHTFLASVYNDALELGWLERNPVRAARRRAKKANTNGRARRQYTLNDITKILDVADVDLADLIQLEVLTGARIGELAALRWRDIDFVERTVTIDATVSKTRNTDRVRAGRYYRKLTTKEEDVRILRLDDATITMLQDRYARHAQQAGDAGVAPESLDRRAVFSRELEEDFTSTMALRGQWNRALDRADVKMRFHDLRHVACSEMMAAGVPVPNATARSGHASNQTFHDVYGHMRRDTVDPALEALAATWRRIQPR